jgi:amidohydrolase
VKGDALRSAAEWTEGHGDELVAFRRQLHSHPEPSGEEVATTELIAQRLRAANANPEVLESGTGLVCDIGHPDAAPVIALRGDIDGLLMEDEKDVPYRSRNEGVAHACGHDVHTTTVLGAGLALDSVLREAGCSVRLLFEPSEERVPGGAVEVIGSGWLEGIRAVYGLHCDPKLDAGTVGTRVGPITSAADLLTLTLRGPGGHTARPQLTVDMVSLASRIAIELPELLAERSEGKLLLVFGSIRSGEAANVIPTTAHLAGSLRTPDPDAWASAGPLLVDSVEVLLAGSGAEWSVDHRRGVPPVVNHTRETEIMSAATVDVLGEAGLVDTPQSVGGDSYAWYLEATGGTYARLGTHRPGGGERLDLHSGDFDVDESSIGIGTLVLAAAVCRELGLA